MDAKNVADMIVSSVKKSNLNFILQESPFSLNISIRKSFIKNKDGYTILPPASILQNSNEIKEVSDAQKMKVENLEQENSSLYDSLGKLQVKLQEAHDAPHKQGIQLENAELEIITLKTELKVANEDLSNTTAKMLTLKNQDIFELTEKWKRKNKNKLGQPQSQTPISSAF